MDAEPSNQFPTAPETEELAQFVPVGLCQLLLGGEVEPEHRPAAVAFIHFQGFDGLIESEGAEVAAQRVGGLIQTIQEAVDQRGVTFLATDIATNGGKIILTAGVPSTTGSGKREVSARSATGDLRRPCHSDLSRGFLPAGSSQVRWSEPLRRTYAGHGRHGEPRRSADGKGTCSGFVCYASFGGHRRLANGRL